MIRLLKWLQAPRRTQAAILDGLPVPADCIGITWHGPVPAPLSEKTEISQIVTDWDVAQAFEQSEPEPGRVEYRFLGVTGEEDA